MQSFFHRITSSIVSPQPIPDVYRSNFRHLYQDVLWFGLLNGSTLSFLTIFATRQGASGSQIGLINAIPAVVALMTAMPTSGWLKQRPIRGGVFWSALVFRLFYALLVPLPILFTPASQVWIIIVVTLFMSVPGTALSIGFNALFAEAVPIEWRGHVAGIRGAVLALSSTISNLACGYILTHMTFEGGYQVVFALGFIGAMLSTFHLYLMRLPYCPDELDELVDTVEAGLTRRNQAAPAFLRQIFGDLRLDVLRGPFGLTLALFFAFHLAQYLAIPVFPLYQVNALHFSDQVISLGSSLFNVFTFLGSLQLARIVGRMGNQRVMGVGVVMLSFYPGLMSITHEIGLFAITSMVGGLAWALAGGVLFNYLLEKVPAGDRPAYLAWYALIFNAAVLLGSLLGPVVATATGLTVSLVIFAACRLSAGLAILRWGK